MKKITFLFFLVLIFSNNSMASALENDNDTSLLNDNPFLTMSDIKAKLRANREDIINKALKDSLSISAKPVAIKAHSDSNELEVQVLAITKTKALISINGINKTLINKGRVFIGKKQLKAKIKQGVLTLYDGSHVFYEGGVSFSTYKKGK